MINGNSKGKHKVWRTSLPVYVKKKKNNHMHMTFNRGVYTQSIAPQ